MKHHLRVIALLSMPPIAMAMQGGIGIVSHFVDVLAEGVERENHRLRELRKRELEQRRKANLPGWLDELHQVRK